MNVRMLALALTVLLLPAAASAHIVVITPNGGELYEAGEVVEIRWCIAIGHTLQNWDLRFHTNLPGFDSNCGNVTGGFDPIAIDVPPTCTNGGGGVCFLGANPCCMTYLWTIPDGIDSDNVKIKIKMDNAGTDYFDLTDAPFSIRPSTSATIWDQKLDFGLNQNRPNPTNGVTNVMYTLERDTYAARVSVFDVQGQLIRVLMNEPQAMGTHSIQWDGRNEAGSRVGSGIYFIRLQEGQRVDTSKLTLLR